MSALRTMLTAYRNDGLFPSYRQLAGLVDELPALENLLQSYRHGAPFPSYAQLAALAYA